MDEKAEAILHKQWSQSFWTFSLVLLSLINILVSIFSASSATQVDPDIQTIALWILLMLVVLLLSFSLFSSVWWFTPNDICLSTDFFVWIDIRLFLCILYCGDDGVALDAVNLFGGSSKNSWVVTKPRRGLMICRQSKWHIWNTIGKGIKCLVGQKKTGDQKIFRKFLRSHCLGLHIVKYMKNYEKVVGRHYTPITSEEYLKALK